MSGAQDKWNFMQNVSKLLEEKKNSDDSKIINIIGCQRSGMSKWSMLNYYLMRKQLTGKSSNICYTKES